MNFPVDQSGRSDHYMSRTFFKTTKSNFRSALSPVNMDQTYIKFPEPMPKSNLKTSPGKKPADQKNSNQSQANGEPSDDFVSYKAD